jgi:hypothetical protein
MTALISLADVFEVGRLDHVAMDGLQFGWHQQLAGDNARLIGKALSISSLGADWLSSFVGHWESASERRRRLARKIDSYFLVGCPVGVVEFAVPPVSVIRGAEGSGLLFTGPIVPGGAGLSIS